MTKRVEFQLLRPPGWIHVPVGESAAEAINRFATSAAQAALPDRRGLAESSLRDFLTAIVEQAASSGAQDMFFPGELLDGVPIPMSITVARVDSRATGGSRMEALTAFAARSPNSEPKQVDGEPAIRQAEELDASFEPDGTLRAPASRQIAYLLWAPGEGENLMLFTGSIVHLPGEEGQEFVEVLEFLFDSIMTTVRFPREEPAE